MPFTGKTCVSAFSSLVLVGVLALAVQIFFFSPIEPDLLEIPFPPPASSASLSTINNQLQVKNLDIFFLPCDLRPCTAKRVTIMAFLFLLFPAQNVIKLGEGLLEDPEDICVDKEGRLYAATRDGWIRRLYRNGSWENWKKIDSRTLLGITTTRDGGLVVCDSEKGLLKVTEDGVTVLVSQVNGSELRFADDVIEAFDGCLYFTVGSTKFDLQNSYLDMLEAKPHGQLLKYNPSSKETSILLDNLAFANGVALSKDEEYLVVCETWKYRCLRYWLKGVNKDKAEIFIENLPGGPDNINLAPDGSFWIALLQLTSNGFEFVHTSKIAKHLVASSPRLIKLVNGVFKKAKVVKVATDGKIIRNLDDSNGKVMTFVTSAVEFEDHLYLGSLNSHFVGKLPLHNA